MRLMAALSVPVDEWETIDDAPATITPGGTMVCGDEALYVLPGGGSTAFWAFKE